MEVKNHELTWSVRLSGSRQSARTKCGSKYSVIIASRLLFVWAPVEADAAIVANTRVALFASTQSFHPQVEHLAYIPSLFFIFDVRKQSIITINPRLIYKLPFLLITFYWGRYRIMKFARVNRAITTDILYRSTMTRTRHPIGSLFRDTPETLSLYSSCVVRPLLNMNTRFLHLHNNGTAAPLKIAQHTHCAMESTKNSWTV